MHIVPLFLVGLRKLRFFIMYARKPTMELVAYLTASVIISWYLDKKSRIGNVAFSILFIVVSSFYLITSHTFVTYLPGNSDFTKFVLSLKESVDEAYGLASAREVVFFTMFCIASGTTAWVAYWVLAFIYRFLVKQIAKVFVRPSVTGGLFDFPLPLSSNVVTATEPIAQTRTYIKFGVLRN